MHILTNESPPMDERTQLFGVLRTLKDPRAWFLMLCHAGTLVFEAGNTDQEAPHKFKSEQAPHKASKVAQTVGNLKGLYI